MSSPRWLLDSNVLMGFLNLDSTPGFLDRAERCIAEGSAISVISYIEVLGWRGHDAHSRSAAELLPQDLSMIELTPAIANRTIALRSQLAIKLPDAVIAVSALVHALPLVTRNVQDFARVGELEVVNPFVLPSTP